MTTSEFRLVDGTSALRPDCSRYRNENEHTIDFSSAAAQWEAQIDYARLAKAQHVKMADRLKTGIIVAADRSESIRAIRTGSMAGTPFNMQNAWKMKAYGCLYMAIGIAVILLGS